MSAHPELVSPQSSYGKSVVNKSVGGGQFAPAWGDQVNGVRWSNSPFYVLNNYSSIFYNYLCRPASLEEA